MFISRHTLADILAQPEIADAAIEKALAEKFAFSGRLWLQLDKIELPRTLPPTRDPRLLALRRLVRRDFAELRAMHRVAALRAAERPYGYLELQLEEVALLGHYGRPEPGAGAPLPFVEDPAFRTFFKQVPKAVTGLFQNRFCDLRARGMAEGARRVCRDGNPFAVHILGVAVSYAQEGTDDPELRAFLEETAAIVLEEEGEEQLGSAIALRQQAVDLLAGCPTADRLAEAMVDLADLLWREKDRRSEAEALYEKAEQAIGQLPLELNPRLRQRLAARREPSSRSSSAKTPLERSAR